jgi:GWxTD domain-containing protein
VSVPAASNNLSVSGGIAANVLDLAGLPPGPYRLTLEIRYPDTTVTRDAEFEVAGFDVAVAVRDAGVRLDADTAFRTLNQTQLDSLYQPLIHIMKDDERGVYDRLTLDGKRNYLRAFWARRDPNPGTGENQAEVAYYAKIAEANRRFHEGGAGSVPGWRTDRGRILIRYGEPDEVKDHPMGNLAPYESWKYTHGRQRIFVFVDKTGLGHYELAYTNERREPSDPKWESIFAP